MSDQVRYGMAIDTTRCVGCQTCTVSCKLSNQVPGDALRCHVENLYEGLEVYQAAGTYPKTVVAFKPELCNHCVDPLCVKNCPTGAMHKDPETGIVSVNKDVCIACGYCSWVCPYGAPSMDDVNRVMDKCDFCAERVAQGLEPYCVESCPANARIFGRLDDPNSELNAIIQKKQGVQPSPEFGTNPSVYYL